MTRWILATLLLTCFATAQDAPVAPTPDTPTTQPTTQPANPDADLRKPDQAEVLRKLLQRRDTIRPIEPQTPPAESPTAAPTSAGATLGNTDDEAPLLEGTFIIERPGRFIVEGDQPRFLFQMKGGGKAPQSLELLPNKLLELMEAESQKGFSEFIISAEVTSYQGKNYLLLRKVLRRVGNDNVAP